MAGIEICEGWKSPTSLPHRDSFPHGAQVSHTDMMHGTPMGPNPPKAMNGCERVQSPPPNFPIAFDVGECDSPGPLWKAGITV